MSRFSDPVKGKPDRFTDPGGGDVLTWFKRKVNRLLNRYGWFVIDDLCIGGHCGCCGAWVPDEIMRKDWPWTLCKKCKGSEENEENEETQCKSD